jgi:hypothetical protein
MKYLKNDVSCCGASRVIAFHEFKALIQKFSDFLLFLQDSVQTRIASPYFRKIKARTACLWVRRSGRFVGPIWLSFALRVKNIAAIYYENQSLNG